jgi:hypothetical protein
MELTFELKGNCCDLALHPVSNTIADKIHTDGAAIYKEKYLNWWRKGNTATCGMRFDRDLVADVRVDGETIPFAPETMLKDAFELRRRMYLDSKANYLSVLGYDNEPCRCVWKWSGIEAFDPAKLSFLVQKWDRIMQIENYYIVDNVLYDGAFADEHTWCESQGFTLLEPLVIDLAAVRRELAQA